MQLGPGWDGAIARGGQADDPVRLIRCGVLRWLARAPGQPPLQLPPRNGRVIPAPTGKIVGTYRLQTGAMAFENAGFYSEREFDFSPYKRLGNAVIELGRACVHRDHRSTDVLYLLWRGIAQYAMSQGGRYLIGCSSLTSQDPARGTAVYGAMRKHLTDSHLRTTPQPDFAMPLISPEDASDKIPKLLRAYLAVGAKICGPPAIDREFKTIDFLTLMDLETLHPRVHARFLKTRP